MEQLKYKGLLAGIEVIDTEESYTSKCSALELEPLKKQKNYLGKRIKRGLFKTSQGKLINADLNGSLNVGRKVVGNDFVVSSHRGCVVQPIRIRPYKQEI
jgi:transposase